MPMICITCLSRTKLAPCWRDRNDLDGTVKLADSETEFGNNLTS